MQQGNDGQLVQEQTYKRWGDSEHQLKHQQLVESNKRVALVTGSATGIGAQIAISLASSGYHVIITGRDSVNMNKVVKLCNDTAKQRDAAVTFRADLYDMSQVDGLIAFIKQKFGNRLNVLVNNACYRGEVKNILDEGSFDDLKRVIHTNVSVPVYMINKFLIAMRQIDIKELDNAANNYNQHKLVIVNISSVASQAVVPLHLYCISKACFSELTRQVAAMAQQDDFFRGRLSALTVSPGPVLTDERPQHASMVNLTLLHRVGTPGDIANLVMFALGKPLLFNGQDLVIDGGYLAQQKFKSNDG